MLGSQVYSQKDFRIILGRLPVPSVAYAWLATSSGILSVHGFDSVMIRKPSRKYDFM
jgi:hypothetical protein